MSLARLRRTILHPSRTDLEIVVFLYAPLLAILLGFVVPLLSIILHASGWSIFSDKRFIDFSLDAFRDMVTVRSTGNTIRIIFKGFDLGVIGNSIVNAFLVTLTATVIGTSIAILVGLYRFPGRRVFAVLAYIP